LVENYTISCRLFIKSILTAISVVLLFCDALCSNTCIYKDSIIVYAAPVGEQLSAEYKVSVKNQEVPVYIAKVESSDKKYRDEEFSVKRFAGEYFEKAAFAYFDMQGGADITVSIPLTVNSVKILPSSAHIEVVIKGNTVSFHVASPQQLTIEINGNWIRSLHLFINPLEKDKPKPNDPNVIYFGPGIHTISHLEVDDNKTVYIAGGAIVRVVIDSNEKYQFEGESTVRLYSPSILLKGKNITLKGRGILDGSLCPTHARRLLTVKGENILLEGIILRDAPTWAMPISQSKNVRVDNLKLLGFRSNSDGIDIVSSKQVTVQNCFIRTNDDLVVVKTDKNQGTSENILVQKCVLWNQLAHALSIGAEVSEDVSNVVFRDCDIIHDTGREWSLRIFHSDAAVIKNVSFENIRIEEANRFISLWIGKGFWSRDEERGHIEKIKFKNISVIGKNLSIDLAGYDESHLIENTKFENIRINGQLLTKEMVKSNDFVKGVSINP
jgi:hypothetical protein